MLLLRPQKYSSKDPRLRLHVRVLQVPHQHQTFSGALLGLWVILFRHNGALTRLPSLLSYPVPRRRMFDFFLSPSTSVALLSTRLDLISGGVTSEAQIRRLMACSQGPPLW